MENRKGYIKINIGGKLRPLKFGTNQALTYCDFRGITFSEYLNQVSSVATSQDVSVLRDVIYSALVAGAKTDKIEEEFDAFTVGDWFDEMDQEELAKAFDTMASSNAPNGQAPKTEKPGAEITVDQFIRFYIVQCGLTLDEFLNLSWYEADLIVEQKEYREQKEWLHTRTLVSALTGEAPTKIITLPLFDNKPAGVKAPSKEAVQAIIEKYKHLIIRNG